MKLFSRFAALSICCLLGVYLVFYQDEQRLLSPPQYVLKVKLQSNKSIQLNGANVCGQLIVKINRKRGITLNKMEFGSLSDTTRLTRFLSSIFDEREQYGSGIDVTGEVIKAVVIEADESLRYGEIVGLIDNLKSSGASPIILKTDDCGYITHEGVCIEGIVEEVK